VVANGRRIVGGSLMEQGPRNRGFGKPGLRGRASVWPRCAAMAVGSMPHTSPREAMELVLATTPEIPAWPQLPRRSYLENMYVQFTEGLPGRVLDLAAERMHVLSEVPGDEAAAFLEALEVGDPDLFALSPEYASGVPELLKSLRRVSPPFVKGQVTGPVSFGLTVTDENRRALLYDDTLRDIATRLLTVKALWQERLLATAAPAAVALIMFDEPFLTQFGSGFISIPEDISVPLLEECLSAVSCLTGIHVCGATDWTKLAGLPVDVLNFDAADHLESLLAHAEAVAAFVGEGGLLAWGSVPNDERALTLTAAEVADTILEGARVLAAAGSADVERILAASFVAPACGTGGLTRPVAERCLTLAAQTCTHLRAVRPHL
jgi:UDP-N-acetylglucosamine transferase subunit ALG13